MAAIKKITIFLALVLTCIFLFSCGNPEDSTTEFKTETDSSTSAITYEASSCVSVPIFFDYGKYDLDSRYRILSIACDTPESFIRYTFDDSSPNDDTSIVYTPEPYDSVYGPCLGVLVPEECIVKAVGVKDGLHDSSVATITLSKQIIETPVIQWFAPTYSSNPNYYLANITCSTPGVTIRYTTDGSEPNMFSKQYSGTDLIRIGSTYHYGVFIPMGADLLAVAEKKGYLSAIADLSYGYYVTPSIIDYGPLADDPSYRIIAIDCDVSSAVIRYTTDGSTPSLSSAVYNPVYKKNSGGFSHWGMPVRTGTNLKVKASLSTGYDVSGIMSYSVGPKYSIQLKGISTYGWESISPPRDADNYYCYASTNQGASYSSSVMKVTIMENTDYFAFCIRSCAQAGHDCVYVSKLNASGYPTSSSDSRFYAGATSSVKSPLMAAYTKVHFNNVHAGDFFYIVFNKDSSVNSNEDTGYVLLPK